MAGSLVRTVNCHPPRNGYDSSSTLLLALSTPLTHHAIDAIRPRAQSIVAHDMKPWADRIPSEYTVRAPAIPVRLTRKPTIDDLTPVGNSSLCRTLIDPQAHSENTMFMSSSV